MNLKILFVLLLYYGILSTVFLLGAGIFDDFSNPVNLNSSELTNSEIDTGGLFNTGISFTRFTSLITIGIGLPESTPSAFKLVFFVWQTMLLVFTIGFIVSSIWNG